MVEGYLAAGKSTRLAITVGSLRCLDATKIFKVTIAALTFLLGNDVLRRRFSMAQSR